MSGRIDQLLNGFADGDAISHEAVILRQHLKASGYESEIFAPRSHVSPSLRESCRDISEYRGSDGDTAIHHYSTRSPALDAFLATPSRRILRYHNITPDHYFRGFDDRLSEDLRDARARLIDAARNSDAVWSVSAFNAGELEQAGIENIRVFPLLFDPAGLERPSLKEVLDRFTVKLTTFLTVGRIVPNKRLEILIEAFYWYNYFVNPYSRLVIVGSERSCPRYFTMLNMMVADFDLPNVCFEGFASPEGLSTYYRIADAYVTTSEHEGYCLPLVEAMHMNVPVIAHRIGGIPEALGDAGAQYNGLDPNELASLMDWVTDDDAVRRDLLESQDRRMQMIRTRAIATELADLINW